MQIDQELRPIILKFPHLTTKIIQLYNHDLNFKSLCEDYLLSCMLLQVATESKKSDVALKDEYINMCQLLEIEIVQYLKK